MSHGYGERRLVSTIFLVTFIATLPAVLVIAVAVYRLMGFSFMKLFRKVGDEPDLIFQRGFKPPLVVGFLPLLTRAPASAEMIIDHAGRLHERVHGRRPDEPEPEVS